MIEKNIEKLPEDVRAQVEPLILRPVRIVVLYKPTGETTMKDISIKDARAYILACIKSVGERLSQEHGIEGLEPPSSDFFAFLVDWEDKTVTPTQL